MAVTKPPKPKKNRLTAAHRTQFWQAVLYWQQVLGLLDWRFDFAIEPTKRKRVMAQVSCDFEQHCALFELASEWDDPITPRTLSEAALHEMGHVFLHDFKEFCKNEASEEDISSSEHRIINTLERLLSNVSPLGPK